MWSSKVEPFQEVNVWTDWQQQNLISDYRQSLAYWTQNYYTGHTTYNYSDCFQSLTGLANLLSTISSYKFIQINGFGLLVIQYYIFKTVSCATKNLKKKAVLNLKHYCMSCHAILSNVFQLMHMKMCIRYSTRKLLRRLASYKVCSCLLLYKSLYCTVWLLILWESNFCGFY